MICAHSNGYLPDENGQPGKCRVMRHAESGTFDTEVRPADADALPDHPPAAQSNGTSEPESLARAERKRRKEEKEIEKQMKKLKRLYRLEQQQIEERMEQRAKSGTFSPDARQTPGTEQADPNTYENEPPEQDFSPEELTQKQQLALREILCGESNTTAAKVAGVNRRTIYRWRQLPAFQAQLHRAQNKFANQMEAKMAPLANEAVTVIQEALQRGNVPAALDLLKGTKILSGRPLTNSIEGDLDAPPHPATVFPLPVAAETEVRTAEAKAEPAAAETGENAETVKPQIAEPGPTLADLLPPQQLAIAELLSGKTNMAVAQAIGESPRTLLCWLYKDEAFRHVLRSCRIEQQQRWQTRLLCLGDLAIEVLRHALTKRRDVRVAFAILRGLGMLARES